MMQSRIFRGLLQPLAAVATLATLVATYETLREVEIHDSQSWHWAKLLCIVSQAIPQAAQQTHLHGCRIHKSLLITITLLVQRCQLWVHILSCSYILAECGMALSSADGIYTACKCSLAQRSSKRSLGLHQLCFVPSAGVQNQHLLCTMGRGPRNLGRHHKPIQRHSSPGQTSWVCMRIVTSAGVLCHMEVWLHACIYCSSCYLTDWFESNSDYRRKWVQQKHNCLQV